MFKSIEYYREETIRGEVNTIWKIDDTDFGEVIFEVVIDDENKYIQDCVFAAIELYKFKKVNVAANLIFIIKYLANENLLSFEDYLRHVIGEFIEAGCEYLKYKEDMEKYLLLM